MEVPHPVAPPRRKPEPVVAPPKSPEEMKAEKFIELHNDGYQITSEAMKQDEEGKRDQAFNSYQKALQLIDKAVSIALSGEFSEDMVDKVDDLCYKMRMTRKQILERVSDIQHTGLTSDYLQGPSNPARQPVTAILNDQSTVRQPPTYESLSHEQPYEYQSTTSGMNSYTMLNTSLNDIAAEENTLYNPLPLNAQEVFTIADNVQIYFISKDDNVSAPTYPSFLRIVVINQDQQQASSQPPAFIQVGDWTYPLLPSHSPIYHAPDGSYVFPDLRADAVGASVGLILPADLSAEKKQALEDILLQLIGQAALRVPVPESPQEPIGRPKAEVVGKQLPESTLGYKIAAGLMSGAEKLAHGLVYGAEKTSQYMDKGASYLVTKIEPAQEKPVINPEVRSGMKTARNVTGKAVKVSAFVVNQLSKGTMKLGHHIAPYVHRTATQLYAKTLNTNEAEASGKMDQIIEVTGGAVAGFGTVFLGLEHAATVLAKSLRTNTVTVVQHKYGHDAGSFCEDTTSTIGNTVVTGYNVKGLAPKALAKRVAKDTGKAIVTCPKEKSEGNTFPTTP